MASALPAKAGKSFSLLEVLPLAVRGWLSLLLGEYRRSRGGRGVSFPPGGVPAQP